MSHRNGPLFFVGIDWATTGHAVCVLGRDGRTTAAVTRDHTAVGFVRLTTRLGKLGPAEQAPFAVERRVDQMVDALVESGHPVPPVRPNAITTWREAEVLPGAKSVTRASGNQRDVSFR